MPALLRRPGHRAIGCEIGLSAHELITGARGNSLFALPARYDVMTDNRIYQSIESPKE